MLLMLSALTGSDSVHDSIILMFCQITPGLPTTIVQNVAETLRPCNLPERYWNGTVNLALDNAAMVSITGSSC